MRIKSFGRVWDREVVSCLFLDVLEAKVEEFIEASPSDCGEVIAVLFVVEIKHRVAPPNVLPESGIESKNFVFLRTSHFERNISGIDPSIKRTTRLHLFQEILFFGKLPLQILDWEVTDPKEHILVQFKQQFPHFSLFFRIH